jgi:large subunit ribosomal protein L17
MAAAFLTSREAVDRLFNEVSPRYGDRSGGYLRIIRTGFRKGDGGEKAFIELLGSEKVLDERREKRAELRAKRREEMEKAMQEQQPNLEASGGPAAGEGEKKSE